MQAPPEDAGSAKLMGINTNRIITLTFAVGSALARSRGSALLQRLPPQISPHHDNLRPESAGGCRAGGNPAVSPGL